MLDFQLLPWRMEYAPDIAPLANNPAIFANLRDVLPQPYTLEDARDFIGSALTAGNGTLLRAIVIDGRAAGSIALYQGQDIYRQCAEIGYWLGQPYWGQGVMSRAVAAMCAQGFAQLPIRRIYAQPFARNAASRRVLEKNGFVLEGIMRQGAIKLGETLDWCMYAKLRA